VEFTAETAKKELENRASRIEEADLRNLIDKRDEIESKLAKSPVFTKFIDDVKLLFSLTKDYIDGSYRKVPFRTIASIAATLLYIVNPIDIVPDFIPGVGLLDDVLIIAVCLRLVAKDLQDYRDWKTGN